MSKKIIILIVILALLIALFGYFFISIYVKSTAKGHLEYSEKEYWYDNGYQYDENKIDVFYCLSTTLLKSVDSDGNKALSAALTPEDRKTMDLEYQHISTKMFDSEHFNFFAPYYRQMTFETYDIPASSSPTSYLGAYKLAQTDICDAFDYYMEHQNNGRPFIIAGFSQGAMMTETLLKHMTDEQYSRLIASYTMGYQVTEKDLKHSHFKAATSADDLGVIVSYNSVASVDHIWEGIEGKAAICINPLNWKTDSTPAELIYDGDKATVHIDEEHHLLVVEGLDSDKYDGMGYPVDKGVYHMWDIRFYADAINQNALHRAELFTKKQ